MFSWIENLLLGADARKRAERAAERIKIAETERSAFHREEEHRRRELQTATAVVQADARRLGKATAPSSLRPASIPDLDEAI